MPRSAQRKTFAFAVTTKSSLGQRSCRISKIPDALTIIGLEPLESINVQI